MIKVFSKLKPFFSKKPNLFFSLFLFDSHLFSTTTSNFNSTKITSNLSFSAHPPKQTPTNQAEIQYIKFQESNLHVLNPYKKGKESEELPKLLYSLCSPSKIYERDLTLFMMSQYIKHHKEKEDNFNGVNILETSIDSSMRGLRILKEIDLSKLHLLVVNNEREDFEASMRLNLKNNDLEKATAQKINIQNQNPNALLISSYLNLFNPKNDIPGLRYDIIDLNCSSSMNLKCLKGAMYSMKKEGGLLCLSFDDISVIQETNKCFSLYGFSKVNLPNNNEHTIRLLYYGLNSMAGTMSRTLQPVLSVVLIDGTIQLYFNVIKSGLDSEKATLNNSQVFKCSGCLNYDHNDLGRLDNIRYEANQMKTNVDKCPYCWNLFQIGGPIWKESINNLDFIKTALADLKDPKFPSSYILHKNDFSNLFDSIIKEANVGNQVFSHNFGEICQFLQIDHEPKIEEIAEELKKGKFGLVASYLTKGLWKTNAPKEIIFQILVDWYLQSLNNLKKDFPENDEVRSRFIQTFKGKKYSSFKFPGIPVENYDELTLKNSLDLKNQIENSIKEFLIEKL